MNTPLPNPAPTPEPTPETVPVETPAKETRDVPVDPVDPATTPNPVETGGGIAREFHIGDTAGA